MRQSKTEINLTDNNVAKNMVLFSIPLILSSWLQLSFNLADYIVCGFFVGDLAVGAIGATGSISALIVDLFIGFSVGVNVLMSYAYGQKNSLRAKHIVSSATLLAIICGLVLALFGSLLAETFLTWMQTSVSMISMSTDYLTIYCLGIPFLLLYNFGAASMRGSGDSFKPFLYLTIGGIINVVMNIILVLPPFNLGTKGLAIATITSEAVSAILVYVSLIKGKGFAHLDIHEFRFSKEETTSILKIGLPAGFQNAMFDIANVLIQSNINSFGDATVTGDSAANRINAYVYSGMDAFAQAGVAFIAANKGARNEDGIKKSIKYAIIFGMGFDVLLAAIEILLRVPLLNLIIHPGEDLAYYEKAMSIGQLSIFITMGSHLLMAGVDIFASCERGFGQSLLPAIVSFIGICVVRILYVLTIFQLEAFHSMEYLYLTYPISWFITAAVHLCCLIHVYKKEMKKIDALTSLSK